MRPALLGLLALASCAAEPLSLHPDNPHYFLFRGRPTVLVTSGEHYGAVLNLDFDFVRYLDALGADGLNHTRLWAGTYHEIPGSFGITENTLAPDPKRFVCPWAQSSGKFDLERWDPAYFTRLRAFMAEASKRGIVVELNLWCPNYTQDGKDLLWRASPLHAANNVNGVGRCPGNEVYALKHPDLTEVQERTTRKLVLELNSFDNLYFEICNEPYFEGVTLEWQRRIAQVIVETERSLPKRHLISQNIANGAARVTDPDPAVSIFNFHYCVPPDAVALNWSLDRAIGENETGFRGRENLLYRTEGWDFILAGGALYNNLDYSFSVRAPDGTFLGYSSPGGGNPQFRREMKVLKDFIDAFDFVRMKPDRGIIRGGVPAMFQAWSLVETGKQYALYIHPTLGKGKPPAPQEIKIELRLELPEGSYLAEWVNPKSGTVDRQERFDHAGGIRTLASETFTEDVALRVLGR